MNYVEDSEYLGSCESLGLLVLMVREWVLSCTTTSRCSWVNWYHLEHWKRQFRPLKINICPQTSQPQIGRNNLALPHNPVISAALEGVRGFSTFCVPISLKGILQDGKAGDKVSVPKSGVSSEQMWCWGLMWNECHILGTILCWISKSPKL